MYSGQSAKARYSPTLFERLADDAPRELSERHPLRLITQEELKESVARDLESLLNARCAFSEERFSGFPETSRSTCSYGMSDFVGLSLANPADRGFICRSLERTISLHERRLKQVRVALEVDHQAVNRLRFAINALLVVYPASEPVHFDALLQPSTLQYSVTKSKRTVAV
jgi:type VI secretion system protein ImpF